MTPTLRGRIQTRLVLFLAIGVPVTLLVVPLLHGVTVGGGLLTILLVGVLGIAWEGLYHALQQLRWDKDWPSVAALAAGLPEALVAWPVLGVLGIQPTSVTSFAVHFGAVWMAIWLVIQGPMRVLAPHWRFHGMQFARPVLRVSRSVREPRPVREREREPGMRSWAAGLAGAVGRSVPQWALVTTAIAVGVAATGLWLLPRIIDGSSSTPVTETAEQEPRQDSQEPRQEARREPRKDQRVETPTVTPKSRASVVRRKWNTSERVEPSAVAVPGLNLSGRLATVGLSPSGAIQTPPRATQAGWYEPGPAPGQQGPAVIVGDMSPGAVFQGVHRVGADDRLVVHRTDGVRVRFVVDRVQRVGVASFPTAAVYGDTPGSTLRLIGFDSDAGENTIVFATARAVVIDKTERR